MTQCVYLSQLAELVDAKLHGDPTCQVSTFATIDAARAGQIAFLDNEKYLPALELTKASAVILVAKFLKQCPTNALVVAKPRLAAAKVLQLLQSQVVKSTGIHPSAVIGADCTVPSSVSIGANAVLANHVSIGEGTVIGPGVVIEAGVSLGAHCVVQANVTLCHGVQIGSEVVISSGVVIGADGFGYEQDLEGDWIKFEHMGSVIIGDRVHIGANTTIDRGALGDTVIKNGVKLDNLIMVAHNVEIGENTVVAGCTAIAGSTKIGRNCVVAGAVAISGHLTIADNIMISGMAMVTKSLQQPGVYSSGTGIMPRKSWQRSVVRFKQLEDIYQRLKILERNNDN